LGNIFFKNSKPRDLGWFRSGKPNIPRMMQSDAHDWMNENDFKVFMRRVLPTKRNHKFCLMIDQSGSMSGEKSKKAMQALVLFMETLEYLGIDYNVIGWSDAPSVYKEFGKGKLDEDQRNEVVITTEMGNGSGSTNDKTALATGIDLIDQESGDQKVIINLTDGEGTSGSIRPELKLAQEKGIKVIAIGISEAMAYVRKNYGAENSVLVSQIDELPESVGDILMEEILGEPTTSPAIQKMVQQFQGSSKTKKVATIPALLKLTQNILGVRWSYPASIALETLLLGLVPGLFNSPLLWVGALALFGGAHFLWKSWMRENYNLSPSVSNIFSVMVLHGLGFILTQSILQTSSTSWAGGEILSLWSLILALHFRINASGSFILPSNSSKTTKTDQLKKEIRTIIRKTGLKLGVQNLKSHEETGSEWGDILEAAAQYNLDTPIYNRLSIAIRALLTQEFEDENNLSIGSFNHIFNESQELKDEQIYYQFLDARDKNSLNQAQSLLDQLTQLKKNVRVAFITDPSFAEKLKTKLIRPNHVRVEFYSQSDVQTLSDSIEQGFVSVEDVKSKTFHIIGPRSMQKSLSNFLDLPDLDPKRFHVYVCITNALNSLVVEFSMNQLGNLKAKIDLILRQA
jgi:hypothetical protein